MAPEAEHYPTVLVADDRELVRNAARPTGRVTEYVVRDDLRLARCAQGDSSPSDRAKNAVRFTAANQDTARSETIW